MTWWPIVGVTAANAAFMTVVSVLTFVFQTYHWWYPEHSDLHEHERPTRGVGTGLLLLAARHEESVLGATLERLAHMDYASYLVAVIIDHPDDPGTLAVARAAQRRYPGRFFIVRYPEDTDVHNKPIGLNAALRQLDHAGLTNWSWLGVVDAEDLLHPHLLTLVDHRFRVSGAAIVQSGVQLMNFGSAHDGGAVPGQTRLARWWQANASVWWRAANCLEYYKWFRSRMSVQARAGVIPLGGNTVFFRKDFVLEVRAQSRDRRSGGTFWDEDCLTEDCKIGMLASAMGHRVDVVYVPSMVTQEETPQTLAKFVRQRVRWMQGFIQVFTEGVWKLLPTRGQRLLAFYVLGFQFFQAYAGVVAPAVFVAGFFFKVPVILVLLSVIPFGLGIISVLVDVVLLHEFGREFALKVRIRDYAGLVYGAVFFQLSLAVAGIWAIARHLQGRTNWVKTAHSGVHLGAGGLAIDRPSS